MLTAPRVSHGLSIFEIGADEKGIYVFVGNAALALRENECLVGW